jgi:hypothetical protein
MVHVDKPRLVDLDPVGAVLSHRILLGQAARPRGRQREHHAGNVVVALHGRRAGLKQPVGQLASRRNGRWEEVTTRRIDWLISSSLVMLYIYIYISIFVFVVGRREWGGAHLG